MKSCRSPIRQVTHKLYYGNQIPCRKTRHILELLRPYYKYVTIRTSTLKVSSASSPGWMRHSVVGEPICGYVNDTDPLHIRRSGRRIDHRWPNSLRYSSNPAMWWAVKQINTCSGCGNSHQAQIPRDALEAGVYDLRYKKIRRIQP